MNRILPDVVEPSSNEEYSVRKMSDRGQRVPKKLHEYSSFRLSALALIVSIIACVLNLILADDLTPFDTDKYLSEHKQLIEDWQKLPFVAVELVEQGATCSEGYEPLLADNRPDIPIICGKRGGKNFIKQVRV